MPFPLSFSLPISAPGQEALLQSVFLRLLLQPTRWSKGLHFSKLSKLIAWRPGDQWEVSRDSGVIVPGDDEGLDWGSGFGEKRTGEKQIQ